MLQLPDQVEDALRRRSSRLPGFYRLSPAGRWAAVSRWAGLDPVDLARLGSRADIELADLMVENAIGAFALPLGIATNFRVNGRDVLVPMAVEEPSVVAAASHGALLARGRGGFEAEADPPVMIGQVQIVGIPADGLEAAAKRVRENERRILTRADTASRSISERGGGARGLEVRPLAGSAGPMLVVHVYFDTRDAMGANVVNSACEAAAPLIEEVSGGRAALRILSNLADRRLARAQARVAAQDLSRPGVAGGDVAARIVEATAFAKADPYRAATHNKGVMNGIDPVVIATGNDWRQVEAGAHAYAASGGRYTSLTDWEIDATGDLIGRLELPLALGTVGGTRAQPAATVCLRILGVEGARELAEVACFGIS